MVLAREPIDAAFWHRQRSLLEKAGIVLALAPSEGIGIPGSSWNTAKVDGKMNVNFQKVAAEFRSLLVAIAMTVAEPDVLVGSMLASA